jgi:guanylate kinase
VSDPAPPAVGALFVVSAPSGGGKTSLTRAAIDKLAAHGVVSAMSVSYTTRAPRPGERDGVDYHFIDAHAFEQMVKADAFLEHAQVFDHRYGTGRAATDALLAQGTDVFLDIDWQGHRQVRTHVPEAIGLFILPPSGRELERRLRARRQDDDAVIARRMARAREEMSHYAEYDYVVVNDGFERAAAELAAVVLARRLRRARQQAVHEALIQELLAPEQQIP